MGRLFWKFFLFTLLAQLIAAAGIGTVLWLEANKGERNVVIETGPPARFTVEAGAVAAQYGGVDALRRLLEHSGHRHPFYAVRDDGEELLGRSVDPKLVNEARAMARQQRGDAAREVSSGGHAYVLFAVREGHVRSMRAEANGAGGPLPPPDGRMEPPPDAGPGPRGGPGGTPQGPPPRFDRPWTSVILGLMPVASAIVGSLIFALGIAWYFSKPIRNLRSAFEAAAAGNLDSRVGKSMGGRRDELSDLGRDFDRMADQLRALMDGQRRLLHDVSHELRSPLARMQAAIGLARQDARKIESTLDRVELESTRMDKLVGELLTLSRVEAGVTPGTEELIDLDELVLDVIEDAQFEADPDKCRLDFSNRSRATVKGTPEWLRRAIENVVRNAVKYCNANGEIVIASSTDRARRTVMIEVLDRGPGVPEAELTAIFEPFFRGNRAENGQNGHGLGLAIAKRIVEGQGGTIAAFNRTGGGLRLEIVLPLA